MSTDGDPPYMTQLLAMVEALMQQNESLQDSVTTLQLRSEVDEKPEEELLEP